MLLAHTDPILPNTTVVSTYAALTTFTKQRNGLQWVKL
jgi:hypothetical protein